MDEILYVIKYNGKFMKTERDWMLCAENARTFNEKDAKNLCKRNPLYEMIDVAALEDGSYDG